MSSFDKNGMKFREYRLRVNGRDVDEDRKEKACLVSEGRWEVLTSFTNSTNWYRKAKSPHEEGFLTG